MAKLAVEIKTNQIEELINQLNYKEKHRLIQKFVNEEFDNVVEKLRRNVKEQKLSSKNIDNIVEKARQEYHDRSSH